MIRQTACELLPWFAVAFGVALIVDCLGFLLVGTALWRRRGE